MAWLTLITSLLWKITLFAVVLFLFSFRFGLFCMYLVFSWTMTFRLHLRTGWMSMDQRSCQTSSTGTCLGHLAHRNWITFIYSIQKHLKSKPFPFSRVFPFHELNFSSLSLNLFPIYIFFTEIYFNLSISTIFNKMISIFEAASQHLQTIVEISLNFPNLSQLLSLSTGNKDSFYLNSLKFD